MTVISTKEFNKHQEKYFGLAVSEDVCIKNDKFIFHLLCRPADAIDDQVTLQPDDELRRAITKEELLEGIYEDIAKRFAKK